MKPTYGRISRYGSYPLAQSFDHIGPITKTVLDTAILLDTLTGYDKQDPDSLKLSPTDTVSKLNKSINKLTIGIDEQNFMNESHPIIKKSFLHRLKELEKQCAKIKRINYKKIKE